jgi:hypothetical protein
VINTVAELVAILQELPQDMAPYMTNGDLPIIAVASATVQPADFGQLVLISRDEAPPTQQRVGNLAIILIRNRQSWQGTMCLGTALRCGAWQFWPGIAWIGQLGTPRHGSQGTAWIGQHGWLGIMRQGSLGAAQHGAGSSARHGWHGSHGLEWIGWARLRLSTGRRGSHGKASRGSAGRG